MNDIKRLLKYVRPHWLTFLFAFFAMVAGAAFETAIGALLVPLFDEFFKTGIKTKLPFDLGNAIPRSNWFYAWAAISGFLVLFTIGKGIAEYFSSYLMAKIGQASVFRLRKELYQHLLSQSANFFERHRSNFLVSRLVVSCAAIELAVSANLRDVLREAVLLFAFTVTIFYFNWRLSLGFFIIAPIVGLLTSKFSKGLRRYAEVSFEGNKELTDTAQETLSNITIVKAYSGEDRELSRFEKAAAVIAKANLRSGRLAALSPPTIELVVLIPALALLYFGLREINAGTMHGSEFFAFLYYLFKSYDPMRKISRQHNEITRAFAAARDVWSVLDENETIPDKTNAVEIGPLEKEIRSEHVFFTYKGGNKQTLSDIDLTIRRGKMVALVGESGAGKSSLVRIIQRFYDVSKGRVTWDGIDLRDIKLSSLRRQIALVSQETVLFNDTVKNNIAYGDPAASDEKIRMAAKVAFADDFIEQLPMGYDTVVGERGTLLSGGQRQRIAIARAVLMDASVLILDEATSALDTESEQLVQQALANLTKDRTSIVIAHRLSTIRRADLIVVMDKGKIIETGTHTELLEKSGKYKRLYELQFAEEDRDQREFSL